MLLQCSKEKNTTSLDQARRDSDSIGMESQSRKAPKPLDEWLSYYSKEGASFALEDFRMLSKDSLQLLPTGSSALYEPEFDSLYASTLIFNSAGTSYLDIDSYLWRIARDSSLSFEADQEVVLVDTAERTKNRLAYFGPSYRIEEAYFEKDSVVMLLGNSYENVPFYLRISLKDKTSIYYQLPDTLEVKSNYLEQRLKRKGIKFKTP